MVTMTGTRVKKKVINKHGRGRGELAAKGLSPFRANTLSQPRKKGWVMKVRTAGPLGYCFGVSQAIEKAVKYAKDGTGAVEDVRSHLLEPLVVFRRSTVGGNRYFGVQGDFRPYTRHIRMGLLKRQRLHPVFSEVLDNVLIVGQCSKRIDCPIFGVLDCLL